MLYDKVKDSPSAIAKLASANKLLTTLGYVAYPLLIILLAIFDRADLVRFIVVPAAGFVTVTIFRYIYNAPRPYEVTGRPALIPKATKGKSFPSRHTFCLFMIAFTWMSWMPSFAPALGPAIGAILALGACFLATLRVALGVHYARDVIAAAVLAAGFAIIGYAIILNP